jgi:hypothetical protein
MEKQMENKRETKKTWLELFLSKRIQPEEKEFAIPLYYIPHSANVCDPYHASALSISHDFENAQQSHNIHLSNQNLERTLRDSTKETAKLIIAFLIIIILS